MTMTTNHQWLLAARPSGMITGDEFKWNEAPVPEPGPGQFVVRVVYVSLDPAMRGWMTDRRSYVPPVGIGEVMRAGGVGEVVASNHPGYAAGDLVTGTPGWQEYAVTDGSGMMPMRKLAPGTDLKTSMGVLGGTGLTAYFGVLDVGQPKPGETVVVSGAAGATGSVAGQIAKIQGCRVVGLAGSDEKCAWLTGELGFDAAINYKTANIARALHEACPKGIDVYFDNVGGEILNTVLAQINLRARLVICGGISGYNAVEPMPGPSNYMQLVVMRARMEGFLVSDYASRFGEAITAMSQWIAEGKLKSAETVVQGLENAPKAFRMLFEGGNTGKLLVQVGPEPR
ncbi:MAG: NADP-dependent oxidoreductase [Chloroflexi bacterium]|nr:NADP-dependent oxidoreductase [Chloroflexota bacterium]